jgi:hypothetical protein
MSLSGGRTMSAVEAKLETILCGHATLLKLKHFPDHKECAKE